MKNKIYQTFSEKFQPREYIRLGENKNLSLYLGKDELSRYAFEFRGKYNPRRISSSAVIIVTQLKGDDHYTLRFSLDTRDLLEYFCTFCEDLFDSTKDIDDDETAYNIICERYFSWKKLFKPHSGSMSDSEIVGLLGELLFLDEQMIPQYGATNALASWTGPEKMHKDFSTKICGMKSRPSIAGKHLLEFLRLSNWMLILKEN